MRRTLRLLRRGLWLAAASTLILVALVLAVANQLLPLAGQHPERVAHWLSARAGRPVAFDHVETEWTRRGPLLRLDNLRVGEGAGAFPVGDTEMLVSLYAGLLPGTPLSELRLRDVDLTLERAADGRWKVRGLPGQATSNADPLASLEGLGELQVIGGRLSILAPDHGINAHLPRVDLRLRVDGDRIRAGLKAWPAPDAQPIDAALDIDRRRGDGRVYAGASNVSLGAWSHLLSAGGITVRSGAGRARAWAELRAHRVERVTFDAAIDEVVLAGAPLDGEGLEVRYPRVEARARWQHTAAGWALHAPTLRFGGAEHEQTLDGLRVEGGRRMALRAARLDAAPLLELATLSDRIDPALRRWLRAARPRAVAHDIDLAGGNGTPLRASARLEGFGFEPIGKAPGLDGVAGVMRGSGDGLALSFDDGASVRIDWPRGFGVVHDVALRGDLVAWRDGAGWRVETPALRIDGQGYAADARGGLLWQGDGTRPRIDVALAVDEASLPTAKGFWVRHLMSPALVRWLDSALVGGRIVQGRAIVSGDLDDWPFADRNGRFEASVRVADATLKFRPGWPAAERLNADLRFVGSGFSINGQARIGDVDVTSLHADIDRYKGGRLRVDAQTRTDARALLAMLRTSPLEPAHRETFANLSADGPVTATFGLTLPLRAAAPVAIDGTVGFEGARLADRRWDLAFDAVRGTAVYSQHGFDADGLAVRHEGQPGRLALRAGAPYVRDARQAFEATLDATLRADALLGQVPDGVDWLKPYVEGRSPWRVGVSVAKAGAGRAAPAARLQLRSNLVGTTLALPAPLSKPAGVPLLTTIDAPLPLGSGDLEIALGTRAALRVRQRDGRSGVRVVLGSGRVDEAPPAHGLVATGQATTLDALDWISLVRATRSGAASGAAASDEPALPLRRIDVRAQRLMLLGGAFADTRVTVSPGDRATTVRVDGPALEGALAIDDGPGAPITGRFERVHWRSASAASRAPTDGTAQASRATSASPAPPSTNAPSPTGALAAIDPREIPPLAFDIADLRVAEARLGRARARTRPTATGLRIDTLDATHANQRVAMTGDWTGRGANARTRIDATLASDNFGALMSGLGFGGRLGGGEGSVVVEATWPGGPAQFALGALDGRLVLDARDGRLLEVEPGAGRVLGLLSLAELPRRLTLDFRDFFSKGFAFNTLAGTVRFGDGRARSDDLRIDGPAAVIDIGGEANLRTQRFDQTIQVHPKAGNLLTAVGAIAGGPVGAALGAAANAVLRKPLGQIGAKTYRVTGPWTDPKVEVISREQSRRVSQAPKPPTG
ncbi:YhdP family protein [Cognatilysobacter bugurensis]|nr:YhdP family protein [Lysobacter bugurensis]